MHLPFLTADPVSGLHDRLTATRLAEVSLAPLEREWRPGAAIVETPDPVWAESLSHAPAETIAAVTRALEGLVLATPDLRPPRIDELPDSRARRHLAALVALWHRMGDALPEGLAAVRHVLNLPMGRFLERLPVVEGSLDPLAPAALRALHDRLRAEFGTVAGVPAGRKAAAGSRLHALQGGIAARDLAAGPADASLAVWGLRDAVSAAEFAAARARALIEAGTAARDIAVLTADDARHLSRAFAAQGVPLSGLPAGPPRRDVIGETALLLLLAKRAPAPSMVLASLALSPLLPWSRQSGRDLGEAVMGGDRGNKLLSAAPDNLALWQDICAPATRLPQLRLLIDRICARLSEGEAVRDRLPIPPGDGIPDWEEMTRNIQIAPPGLPDPARNLEGVSLWSAQESPWRPCRHLIVTDFIEGRYPARPPANPLFLDGEIAMIADATGLHLPGRATALARNLALLDEQLRAVSETVTFLVPWRDLRGERLAPAAGLSLIARAITGLEKAEDLVRDLSLVAPRDWPFDHHRPEPLPERAEPPPVIELPRGLLDLRRAEDGTARPQSPSRLETLIVSPLAWLLDEIEARDLSWSPDGLNVLIMGNVAHDVFEHVFPPDAPLPTPEALPQAVAGAFESALRRHAGFLRAEPWEMERRALERDILNAAKTWHEVLAALGARILGNEIWLRGDGHGILLHGKADTILELPDGAILVVDHKKSSTNGRRQRMEAGWDLQVGLYRDMLARPVRRDGDGLDALLGRRVGIAYHLMNDGGLLTSGLPLPPPARDMGDDVNAEALQHLAARLAEVGAGKIRLNTTADEAWFKKHAGISAYALRDGSPLVRNFLRDEGEEA